MSTPEANIIAYVNCTSIFFIKEDIDRLDKKATFYYILFIKKKTLNIKTQVK